MSSEFIELSEPAYVKDGGEYVFKLLDEATGSVIEARARIANDGAESFKINGDTLALFPERSARHRRIKAYLERRRQEQQEPAIEPLAEVL